METNSVLPDQRRTMVGSGAYVPSAPAQGGVPGSVIALIVAGCVCLFFLIPLIGLLVAFSLVRTMPAPSYGTLVAPRFEWEVPASPAVTRPSASALPNMNGTWVGSMNPGSQRIVLVVTGQSGRHFSGKMSLVETGTPFELQEEGTISPDNQTVELKDTSILYEPARWMWYLDTCEGSISFNGLSIAGVGTDTGGNRFAWSFTKQSDRPTTVRLIQ